MGLFTRSSTLSGRKSTRASGVSSVPTNVTSSRTPTTRQKENQRVTSTTGSETALELPERLQPHFKLFNLIKTNSAAMQLKSESKKEKNQIISSPCSEAAWLLFQMKATVHTTVSITLD